MWTENASRESGYSLVELMVAIVVLTVAILPMVNMFDAGLRAATASGDHDAARACAGQRLEQARSLPYEVVAAGLPGGTCEPSGFDYTVRTEFVDGELRDAGEDQGLTKVTVTVARDGGGSYSLSGVVSRW